MGNPKGIFNMKMSYPAFVSQVSLNIQILTDEQFNIRSGELPSGPQYLRNMYASGFGARQIAEDIIEYWIGVGIIPLPVE